MTRNPFIITDIDQALLLALSRYHYLTAAQVTRLFYPSLNDENRYSQRRLKRLTDARYILRLNALPTPRYGQAPHVFTLGRLGRQYLSSLGISLPGYFRPSEEARAAQNHPFMTHRLAAIDVLVAADCLCRDNRSVVCSRLMTERELKQGALRVTLPPGPNTTSEAPQTVTVIPDAWFQLEIGSSKPVSIALELDRSTEDQKAWRRKVAALGLWAAGPYEQGFQTDNVTIAVVCLDSTRRDTLMRWTMTELDSRELGDFADIFLFTSASPATTPPRELFFSPVWRLPGQAQPESLLEPPGPQRSEVLYLST
jgi:hypothetical protein